MCESLLLKSHKSKLKGVKKLFVWDFHGVLERGTEQAVHEISNHALSSLGYTARFSKELCDLHYGKKWYCYFQALMPDLSFEKCYELQQFCKKYSMDNPHITERCIQIQPEAKQVLAAIAAKGHRQILISNSSLQFLLHYLRLLGLDSAFDRVFANGGRGPNQEKVDVLESYLQQSVERYQEIIAIDDLPENLSFKRVPSL